MDRQTRPIEPQHLVGSGSNHNLARLRQNTSTMQSQPESGGRSGSQQSGASWFIEQWLQRTTSPDPHCNAIAKRRRKHGEMATPPSSHGRALSPAKRRRTDGWASEDGTGFADPEKPPTAKSVVSGTALTLTRRPDLRPKPSGSVASSSVSEASTAKSGTSGASGGTAQRSRSRSTSPAKTTTALGNLDKPVRFPAMAENAVTQLPADVRSLYKHVRNIVVHHEAFMPLSIREDIDSAAGCRHRKTWFYHDAGMHEVDTRPLDSNAAQDATDNNYTDDEHDRSNDCDQADDGENNNDDDDDDDQPPGPSYSERRQRRQPSRRMAALAELDMLVDLIAAANSCRVLGRHEATWNMEVHNPLFRLALDRLDCAHVLVEAVTHASIAPPFLPPWKPVLDGTEARETVDSKRLDFVLALFVDPGFPRQQHGWPGRQRETDSTLAEAIREAVASMPISVGVNQLAYAPLRYSPIAVGVETKTGMSNLEDGRRQLGVCTAAWHQRIQALMAQKTHMRGKKIVTLPLLLILEHEWRLSFAIDAGDAIVRVPSLIPPPPPALSCCSRCTAD